MKHSSFDAMTLALDVETSALGAAIARSYRRYRCGVSGDIGDCGVGITPQMCNRVTNHGDTSTFSKPDYKHHETHVKHREPLVKHREPLVKHREPLVKHHETLKTL